MAKDLGFRIADIGIDEHARNDSMPVEGLPIRKMCVGLTCIGRGIIPEMVRLVNTIGTLQTYHPPLLKALFARSSRSPGSVLNGGTSPVLSFQKSSL